jgi:spore coat protein U-like protein
MPQGRSVMRAGALALLMLVWFPAIAHAALGTCGLVPTDIDFGTYSGGQITGSGSIQIMCSNGSGNNVVQVGISYGQTSPSFPSSTANRLMQSGNNRLAYQIYTTSTRTTIWGDGSGGTTTLGVPIRYTGGQPVTTTVIPFAVLFSGPLPPPGAYNDAVTVTVPNTTTAIHIRANVSATCSVTANDLSFGVYGKTTLDGTTTLTATCTPTTSFNIGLNQGAAPGATVTTRKMMGPNSQRLSYSLYRDSARTLNWGNTQGSDTVPSTGTGAVQTFTVYGRIPALQPVNPGTFQDAITVTVYF